MADKSFFIDTTKCTACRGCQISCKQWNMNPATKTKQHGTHQNPDDLSSVTFKLVRFSELEEDGKPKWYFFADQCRHCIEPPCMYTAQSLGVNAITRDDATGAVLYNPKIKVKEADAQTIRGSCPWDIPRWDKKTGGMAKCTMCIDRISNGMLPACVKTCPTGTMNFGDRDAMLDMANKRLKEVKKMHPKAQLLNAESVRTIFLVVDDPKKYHKFAQASDPAKITRTAAMKKILKPALKLSRLVG
jgi:formate dehydrogenase iron-sulfur subunit